MREFLETILTESWHPKGTPFAVKGLASLLLRPEVWLAGAGAVAGAVKEVVVLLPVEEAVSMIAVDMLLEAVVMLSIGGFVFGIVPAVVGFILTDGSCIQ